jgi:hypothetical protein
MHPEAQQVIRAELASGERLIWADVPGQGLRFRPTDVFLIPFSLLWAGFIVFWELSAFRTGAPTFFLFWGIPFILVGIHLTVGRFFIDRYQRSRTFYGISEQSAIIVSGLFTRQVKILPLRTLAEVSLAERSDGTGTITLGATNPLYSWYAGTAWPGIGKHLPPAFEMIDNVRGVYNTLRDAQQAAMRVGA